MKYILIIIFFTNCVYSDNLIIREMTERDIEIKYLITKAQSKIKKIKRRIKNLEAEINVLPCSTIKLSIQMILRDITSLKSLKKDNKLTDNEMSLKDLNLIKKRLIHKKTKVCK